MINSRKTGQKINAKDTVRSIRQFALIKAADGATTVRDAFASSYALAA